MAPFVSLVKQISCFIEKDHFALVGVPSIEWKTMSHFKLLLSTIFFL